MSDLVKRMKATLGHGVISDGDLFERMVAERQFAEALKRIEKREAKIKKLKAENKRLSFLVGITWGK